MDSDRPTESKGGDGKIQCMILGWRLPFRGGAEGNYCEY